MDDEKENKNMYTFFFEYAYFNYIKNKGRKYKNSCLLCFFCGSTE
jgi:hypothetical protein